MKASIVVGIPTIKPVKILFLFSTQNLFLSLKKLKFTSDFGGRII